MDNVQQNPLGTESISKLMIKFSVPSIIAMIVGALYNIVDQLFIGQAVGTLGNAATNIAFPLSTSCIAVSLLFGIGGASCFNLSMGRGEEEKSPFYVANATIMLFSSGIVLFIITQLFLTQILKACGSPSDVLPYAQTYVRITSFGFPFLILSVGGGHLIRADGSPKIAMFCNILGAVINIILDAVFIFGFNMGMAGAAYATIIGQIASTIVVIVYMKDFKTVPLLPKHFKLNIHYIKDVASIGMASGINQLAMMLVQIILNNSLRYYGGLSIYGEAIPIACAGITMKVSQLFFSVVIGLSQGSQPIESFNYGAKKYHRVKETYILANKTGAVISIIAFILFQLFPREIISLFGSGTEEYYQFAIKFFRIFLFFICINFIQPITSTFFTSIGKPIKGIFLSLTRQIIYLLPMIIILPLFFGIDGIIFAGPVADFIAAITCLITISIEFKNMKQLEFIERQQNIHV
ncbi:MATE family efflux transporter [Intestinibacter sp.]|uniref:MATE family efflux transporter n=1 Tax=Intestinibacter sp. TaxID=1965304 RepID=UPI002A91CD77|nr:MATE family efflux transporter [Intestinibacter sp.]MDY5211377.1 MATE family efflux transporter [Intestinibacter sp.]